MTTDEDSADEGDTMPTGAPDPKKASLAERMKKTRIERGVTQGQLADRFHIKQASISMIESNEMDYSQELAGRIQAWIDSGAGAPKKSPRGPYHKSRSTIQGR